ncbi:MAG: GIY-YIG nuclease family protein [Anaerolineae bacterium]
MAYDRRPGTYLLVLRLPETQVIEIGGLGDHTFSPGAYLYTGSALAGLEARLARHLRGEKRLHWHIDYLMLHAHPIEAWAALGRERRECAWAGLLSRLEDILPAMNRFGASDCRCRTHLFHCPTPPVLPAIALALPGELQRVWSSGMEGIRLPVSQQRPE